MGEFLIRNDLINIDKEGVTNSVKFLIGNRGTSSKNLDRRKVREAVKNVNNASILGFNAKAIKTLAQTIIFGDHYDIYSRKTLLSSMMPAANDFPYEIIPLALSSAAAVPVSPSWQTSVLRWLCGLLDYEIIDVSNPNLHMCYPVIFILLTHLNACPHACKLLCKITRREDVTKHRIQVLLRLNGKPGYCEIVPHLIRIYKIFRPDMIACTVGFAAPLPIISGQLQHVLAAAQERLKDDAANSALSNDRFWPEQKFTKRKRNYFQQPSALPYPDVILYTDKIEEQKEHRINVMQYTSLKELAGTLSRWRSWTWPTSPSSMLWKPSALALFRPHEGHLKICITNWLEIALRTEIVEGGCKNPKREAQLMDATISLAENYDTSVPVIYHFFIEFLAKWDRCSHMDKVLRLLPFVPFVSPLYFFEAVFNVVSFLLVETTHVSLWCRVVLAMGELVKNWALDEAETDKRSKKDSWPLEVSNLSAIDGIYFLTQQMERIFQSSIVKFDYHPAILNSMLGFYDQVNLYCEHLNLPLLIVPTPAIIFAITVRGGPFIQHKTGLILASCREHVKRVKEFTGSVDHEFIRSVTLTAIPTINSCVRIFLDATVGVRGFNTVWMKDFSNFFDLEVLKSVHNLPNIAAYGSVGFNLSYSFLSITSKIDELEDDDSEQEDDSIFVVVTRLEDEGFAGIKKCGLVYKAFDEMM